MVTNNKQRYSMKPESVSFIKSFLHQDREICDIKLEGRWMCVVLDTGLTIKVRNEK